MSLLEGRGIISRQSVYTHRAQFLRSIARPNPTYTIKQHGQTELRQMGFPRGEVFPRGSSAFRLTQSALLQLSDDSDIEEHPNIDKKSMIR